MVRYRKLKSHLKKCIAVFKNRGNMKKCTHEITMLMIFQLRVVMCVFVCCPPFFEAPRFVLRGGWDT